MVGVVGSSPIAPTKFEVHTACRIDVAAGGASLPTEEAAKEFGNACKVHRCIQVSPERRKAFGAFSLYSWTGGACAGSRRGNGRETSARYDAVVATKPPRPMTRLP